MAINISCQCGKQLSVKDEFAGKSVKCPGCGGPLVIPQPQLTGADDGISDLLDDAGMRAGVTRCPGCGAEMSDDAVLCVMCGFDMRRGHRIKTRIGSAVDFDDEDLGDLPVHGVAQLDEAERQIARDKIEQKKLGKGAPWWMVLLAFLGVVGFAVGMVLMPQERVMQTSSGVLQVAGVLLSAYFGIRLLIEGFKESALHGICMIIIPFYSLVYVFTRWDRVGGIFLFIVAGNLLQGIGVAMLYVAPMLRNLGKDEEEGYSLRLRQERPAVVRVFTDHAQV